MDRSQVQKQPLVPMPTQSSDYALLPQCDPGAATNDSETPLLAYPDNISMETLVEEGGIPAEQKPSNLATLSNFYAPQREVTDGRSDNGRVAQTISQAATLTFDYVSACILSSIASSLYSTLAPFFGWVVLYVLGHEPYASHGGVIICAGMIGAPILASGLVTIAWAYQALEAVYESAFGIYHVPRARQFSRHGEGKPRLAHRYRGAVYMSCIILGAVVCGVLSPAVGLPILNKHAKPDILFSPAQGVVCAIVGLAFVFTVVFVCVAMHNALGMMEGGCGRWDDSD